MEDKIKKLLSSGNIDDITIGWEFLLKKEPELEDWHNALRIIENTYFIGGWQHTLKIRQHLSNLFTNKWGYKYKSGYIFKSYENSKSIKKKNF